MSGFALRLLKQSARPNCERTPDQLRSSRFSAADERGGLSRCSRRAARVPLPTRLTSWFACLVHVPRIRTPLSLACRCLLSPGRDRLHAPRAAARACADSRLAYSRRRSGPAPDSSSLCRSRCFPWSGEEQDSNRGAGGERRSSGCALCGYVRNAIAPSFLPAVRAANDCSASNASSRYGISTSWLTARPRDTR